jgi:tol-pal system protein YbgF
MNNKSIKTLPIALICFAMMSSPETLAASKNNSQLTDDVNQLQQGLGKIEQDMQRLQRLLDNRAMLELFQRMDELSDEVSQLRGQMELQNNDLAGLKKRQRELYLDTDRRLRELEITSTGAPASAPIPGPTSTPKIPAPATVPAAPVSQAPVPAAVPPAASKAATIRSPTKSSVPVSEEREAYQKAFDMLKEGRYKMADTSFKQFLSQFPQSSYAGNAQYWLGESNYVTRQFEQAIKEFRAVLTNYPRSNKVPDAMLKLGYTYYELRQFDQARSILEQLKNDYSLSTAARLAEKRLNRMKKEGQ